MVILRPTRKLRSLLPTAALSTHSDTALGDWYVNRIVVDRQPLLLVVSSASLLPMLLPARDVRGLPDRLAALVERRLRRCQIEAPAILGEQQAMRPVGVAPTVDRSVLGIMVEFARAVPYYLQSGRWTAELLAVVEDRLGETPCHAALSGDRVVFPNRKAPELLRAKWLANEHAYAADERQKESGSLTIEVALAAERHGVRRQEMTEDLKIRFANPADADELFAIRRDAIMALAEEYGRMAVERWASAAPPDRAAKAIATNSVWLAELGSQVVGWVEVSGATIESLYVSSAAARRGVGSALLAHAERQVRDAGAAVAYLDASPNAEAFYSRRGYGRIGPVKANNSIPMSKRLDLSAV